MSKALLVVLGIINLLFVGFHVFLGYRLHMLTGVPDGVRGLLETFNACCSLVIALLAYAFLTRSKDVLSTGLGAAVLTFGALLYFSRAAAEYIWLAGSLPIALVCITVGLLHALALFSVRTGKQGA